jgi:deoxycytidine triphosphate deaminase
MVIIGRNLLGLIRQYDICPERLFDRFSISLELDDCVLRPRPPASGAIRYDMQEVEGLFEEQSLASGELVLAPGEAVLACSSDIVRMPIGYIGMLQAKGSLARLFVSVHCSDSQVEPGFIGKVTFELVNHSPFRVALAFRARVAQLFIFKCSTANPDDSYNGRYQNASKPTLPRLVR